MSSNVNQMFQTTTVRGIIRTTVASLVGALIAWGTTKLSALNASSLSYLIPVCASLYYALIHTLETQYPQLGWLLGVLPHSKASIPSSEPAPVAEKPAPAAFHAPEKTSTVAEKPVAKKAVAKKAAAPQKAAPKKKY